jgi:hypothetical protein
MDLIDEIGSDLAVAFLIEKRHSQKIESREAIDLINRIQGLLSGSGDKLPGNAPRLQDIAASQRSH